MSEALEQRLNMLLLRFHDEVKAREALELRVSGMAQFLQNKFPGEIGPETILEPDPKLNETVIILNSKPQMNDPASCPHPGWRDVNIGDDVFTRCIACGADFANVEKANAG